MNPYQGIGWQRGLLESIYLLIVIYKLQKIFTDWKKKWKMDECYKMVYN